MNRKLIAIGMGFLLVVGAANAQVVSLSGVAHTFSLGGGYKNLSVTPSYSVPGTTSLDLSGSSATRGSINGWNFVATTSGSNVYLSKLTFVIQLTGVTASSKLVAFNISSLYDNSSGVSIAGPGIQLAPFSKIESLAQYNSANETLTFVDDVSSYHTKQVEFEFNTATLGVGVKSASGTVTPYATPEPSSIATMALGSLGLLIRRRKAK